jgi:hypothetical protein
MSASPENDRHGGDSQRPVESEKSTQPPLAKEAASRSSGSAQIASVVFPFLESSRNSLRDTELRLEYGARKFDISTGEKASVYFRLVDTKHHKASHFYIIDLSSPHPLILMVDSLDIGSTVRRREVLDQVVNTHDDITEEVLAKLLDRAVAEVNQK